jgi:PPIC-type PPIASE domain
MYSDDLPSKAAGGFKGWMSKASAPKEYLESGLFDLEVGGIAKLVEASYGFEILKVEEKKAAAQRPLDEVRAEIEETIRKQEAPAYAAAKAREIVDAARKGGSFESLSQAAGFTVQSTIGLLGDTADPVPSLTGLTTKVLQLPLAERLLPSVLEVGSTTVMVKGKEFFDPSPAPFNDVKPKVIDALKSTAAKTLAEAKAKELLEVAKSAPTTDLKTAATAKGLTYVGPFKFTRSNPAVADFKEFSADIRDALLSSDSVGILPSTFSSGDTFVVVYRNGVTIPADSPSGEKFKKYEDEAFQASRRRIAEEMISLLKSKAEINFEPGLLGSGSAPS